MDIYAIPSGYVSILLTSRLEQGCLELQPQAQRSASAVPAGFWLLLRSRGANVVEYSHCRGDDETCLTKIQLDTQSGVDIGTG